MNIIRHFVRKPVSDFVGKLRSGLMMILLTYPDESSAYNPITSPTSLSALATLAISSIQPVPRTHLLLRYLAPCHVSSFHLLLQHHQETALSPFPPCLQTAHTIFNLHNISRNKFPFWGWIANHI